VSLSGSSTSFHLYIFRRGVDGDLPRQRRPPLEHRLRLARQAEVPVRRHPHAVCVKDESVLVHGDVALTSRELEDRRALVDLVELSIIYFVEFAETHPTRDIAVHEKQNHGTRPLVVIRKCLIIPPCIHFPPVA
jgi:hypothetical protein